MKPFNLRLLLFFLPVTLCAGPLLTEDFSAAEDKHGGEPIDLHPGWYAVPDDGALITSDDWMSGGQSLVLLPGYPVTEAVRELPPGIDPLYLEVWIRPVFDNPPDLPAIDAEGARLFFVRDGVLGKIAAGDNPEWVGTSDLAFGVLDDGLSDRWIRVALELDHAAEQWSLAVDGEVVLEGLPGSRESFPGEIVFLGHRKVPIYIDALRMSTEPFVEFKTHQGGDETSGDLTLEAGPPAEGSNDLLSGKQSVGDSSGHHVHTPDEVFSPDSLQIVYVDNSTGDDRFDGRSARPESEGRGPVATLGAALVRVQDGGTIVIYEGNEPYREQSVQIREKSVNFKPIGSVQLILGERNTNE